MEPRKRMFFLFLSLLVGVAVVVTFLLFLPKREEERVIPASLSYTDVAYVLRARGGKIAVYEGYSDHILETWDTDPASLPELDRRELEIGIPVYSEEELVALFEDYTS